jgi:4-aminobutyrate aminotransferase-like enzyme
LINAPRAHTLRLMPSLRVTAREIDEMLRLLDDTLSQV